MSKSKKSDYPTGMEQKIKILHNPGEPPEVGEFIKLIGGIIDFGGTKPNLKMFEDKPELEGEWTIEKVECLEDYLELTLWKRYIRKE